MTTKTVMANGFLVRTPTLDDVKPAYEVVHACDMADAGKPDHTLEDFQLAWQEPDFNLATDAWCVVTSEGRMVAVADTGHREHVRIYSFIRVHPDFRSQGIEEHLLELIEARAKQHIPEAAPHARVTLGTWVSHNDMGSAELFLRAGYKQNRSFWRMQIDMDSLPQQATRPAGITVRTLITGKEEHAVFDMMEEAFRDHWGHLPSTFENWAHWELNPESFDPTLWFLAFDGDKLAGGSLCRYDKDLHIGWVNQLAVLRPWRRKGLGIALLLHSFAEFYRRGIVNVGLGVDAQNLTGATRLYERAGMHVALQHDTYEKELRAGQELSTQSISL